MTEFAYFNDTRVRIIERATLPHAGPCTLVEWPNATVDPDGIASRSWVGDEQLRDRPGNGPANDPT